MLFADLRDSTQLAAGMSASAYSRLLNGFYGIASRAVEGLGGSIDKYLGDGVFALFIPGFAGRRPRGPCDRSRAADPAGDRPTLQAVGMSSPLPVGIGVHTGTAYVGVVGNSGELTDFTALGDAVNVTERLSSAAVARELLDQRRRPDGVWILDGWVDPA